jgi:hypothetical protein
MRIESAKYFKPSPPDTGDENIGIFLILEGDDLDEVLLETDDKLLLESSTVYNIPITEDNRHYRAIQEWVAAGNTIADAD